MTNAISALKHAVSVLPVPRPGLVRAGQKAERRDGSSRGWRRRRATDRDDMRAFWLPSAAFVAQMLQSFTEGGPSPRAAIRAYQTATDRRARRKPFEIVA